MRRGVVALASIGLFASMACASEGSAAGSGGELTGVTWMLDRASMMTLVDQVPTDARVDLVFDGSQMTGRAACNSYGGSYTADADAGTLAFSDVMQTEMACDAPLMDVESAYLAALRNVDGYQVVGEQRGLVLTGGTAALTFAAKAPAEPKPIEGPMWELTTIAEPGGQAVSSIVGDQPVWAGFLADGSVSGSGGCNEFHATYQTDGNGLTIGAVTATKMACADDVMAQEQVFLDGLETAGSYTIEANQLNLFDADGQLLLGFSVMPSPSL
jgi:heat shock protein HslJ